MDFSSLTGMAKKLMGNATGGTAGMMAKVAGMTGMSPAAMEQVVAELKGLLADGKITPDELRAELTKMTAKMGVPQAMVPTVVDGVMKELQK